MNELSKKEIQDYLKVLPDSVIDAILDKTWPKRTDEIASKYSLSEEQTNILRNLVLFVIIGVESPETLQKSIEVELGISNLLSEQLMKDIDNRVFQYIYNLISENQPVPEVVIATTKNEGGVVVEKGKIVAPQPESEPRKILTKEEQPDFDVVRSMSKDIEYLKNGQDPVMHTIIGKESSEDTVHVEKNKTEKPEVTVNKEIPEIRPDISPAIETEVKPVEKQQINNVPHNLPGMQIEENTPTPEIPQIKIDDLGDDKVFVGSEFIKESEIPKENVPQNTETKPAPPKWGSNINDGSTTTPETKEKKGEEISVPRYTSDPYREPVE